MNGIAFKPALIFSHAMVLTLLAMMMMAESPSRLGHFVQGTDVDRHAKIFASHLF
ncbi:hypothetical protein C1752_03356 [Acaryochloris thomasi RCC1774]|uniref:Uncharacterized protein n=1 Tax=Acaryochloris thomasi RCC1774 TaxID=1764569 RepID=A0A2W1JSL8_9CYAN|nr:hypothetical protein [Acaryochloris thomasi]PZD72904.1 hypothetical protein C1752_03356 [Acaryochloris thomasi RCC1774]